jgi:phosphoadenylyl-sulfate reductase (thioredoxin)
MAGDAVRVLETPSRVELNSATPIDEALVRTTGADAIDIRFDVFKDGRGFSLAAILRERGFDGELRAIGHVLPDQQTMLRRVGFTEIEADDRAGAHRFELEGIESVYQPSVGDGDGVEPAWRIRALAARKAQAIALAEELEGASPEEILTRASEVYGDRIAMLSSFGTEAALGLALVSKVAPKTPVLFLDTHRHFPATLSYRDMLIDRLDLQNVVILKPDADEGAREDADQKLYERDSAACCDLRKVRPLNKELDGYDALITGRKRYHGGGRETLKAVEFDGERVKINPLAFLTPEGVSMRYASLKLPPHPLVAEGYSSIGCWPCTAANDELGSRAGRWAGEDRTECGIFDTARVERAKRANSVCLI